MNAAVTRSEAGPEAEAGDVVKDEITPLAAGVGPDHPTISEGEDPTRTPTRSTSTAGLGPNHTNTSGGGTPLGAGVGTDHPVVSEREDPTPNPTRSTSTAGLGPNHPNTSEGGPMLSPSRRTSSPPSTLPGAVSLPATTTESSLHPLPSTISIPTAPSSSSTTTEVTPSKPSLSRRSSQFHSSRPAPPSPAPSRRTSQIHSPALSSRDRASSTSSSAAGPMSAAASNASGNGGHGSGSASGLARKLSQNQSHSAGLSSRNSISKTRPRSSLGTSMYTGGDDASASADADKKRDRQSLSAPQTRAGPASSMGSNTPVAESSSSTSSKSTARLSSKPSQAFSTTNKHNEEIADSSTSISPLDTSSSPTAASKPSTPAVIIKDYAFPSSDERYHGRGQPVAAAESSTSSRLSSFLANASAASPSDQRRSSTSENKRDKEKGWSFSMLSWRGFIGRKSRSNSRSEGPNGDESGVLGSSGRSLDTESEPDLMATGTEGAEDDYAFESSSEDDEEPFGLYRAAYAFEAVGEHEISLEEGEVVEVKGRGGGEGWVIAVKLKSENGAGTGEESGKDMIEGLVPEGYIEKVEEEELRAGMIHAGFQGGQRRTVAPDGISEEPEESSDLESGAER